MGEMRNKVGASQYLDAIKNMITSRVSSGTYSPTISDESNISGASIITATYTRIGDVITVYGGFAATATASGVKRFAMTLPISPGSNFTGSSSELAGTMCRVSPSSAGAGGVCRGKNSTELVDIEWYDTLSAGADPGKFHFSYELDP